MEEVNIKIEEEDILPSDDDKLESWMEPQDIVHNIKLESEDFSEATTAVDMNEDLDFEHVDVMEEHDNVKGGTACFDTEFSGKASDGEEDPIRDYIKKDTPEEVILGQDESMQSNKDAVAPKNNNKVTQHVDEMIRKISQDAPLSESVSSSCKFKCPECHRLFMGWNMLYKHVVFTHTDQKVSIAQVVNFLSEPVFHICKICSEKVLCDVFFLNRHLRRHKLELSQYKKNFGLKNDGTGVFFKVQHIDMLIKQLCRHAPVSKKVLNMSTFQCPECEESIKGWHPLRSHVVKTHVDAKPPLTTQLCTLMSKPVCHICKICSAKVLCDTHFIDRHLRKHYISVKQYKKNYNA